MCVIYVTLFVPALLPRARRYVHGGQQLLFNSLMLLLPHVLLLLDICVSCCCLMCRYVHGGQELLFNSLAVPYYRAGQFTGAAIGARHNLEVGRWGVQVHCERVIT